MPLAVSSKKGAKPVCFCLESSPFPLEMVLAALTKGSSHSGTHGVTHSGAHGGTDSGTHGGTYGDTQSG